MRALPLARNGRTKEPGDQGRNPGARRPLLSAFQAMEGKIASPRLDKEKQHGGKLTGKTNKPHPKANLTFTIHVLTPACQK